MSCAANGFEGDCCGATEGSEDDEAKSGDAFCGGTAARFRMENPPPVVVDAAIVVGLEEVLALLFEGVPPTAARISAATAAAIAAAAVAAAAAEEEESAGAGVAVLALPSVLLFSTALLLLPSAGRGVEGYTDASPTPA